MSDKERLVPEETMNTPPPEYTPTATITNGNAGQNGTINPSFNPTAPQPLPNLMTFPPPPASLGCSLQDSEYWTVMTNVPGVALQCRVTLPPKDKSLLEAYLLWLPLGLLGTHHFYLGRYSFGVMYMLSLGLFGVGWLVDLFRLPCLVSSVNRANRARHEQLQHLQQQLQQQRMQHERQYGRAVAFQNNVQFVPFEPRTLVDAYILWFPCGLLGYHHFYLRNYGMGILYYCTLGLLGFGWLIDLFRMPSLVREANDRQRQNFTKTYSQCAAHAIALSPAGILGGHHYYLNRPLWGFLYLNTLGLLGVGWMYDWFRISCLVKRANAVQRGERSPQRKYLDDAYILCFPLGFTGLHHFYLQRYGWGVLYLLTLGMFGIGWVIDFFRLPCLVRDFNSNLMQSQRLISAGSGTGNGSLGVTSSGMFTQNRVPPTAPSVNPPIPRYGYDQPAYPGLPYPASTTYPTAFGAPGYTNQGEAPPSYQASVGETLQTPRTEVWESQLPPLQPPNL